MEKLRGFMFSYKIVLVGDFGTGKTSLIKRFVDNRNKFSKNKS